MKKPETERCRVCVIIFGILMYLIIMFPPIEYVGLGRVYGVLNWKGNVLWEEICIEIAAALIIAAIVFFLYPVVKRNSISD